MKINIILVIIILFPFALKSQIAGEEPPEFNEDTLFIFESPRPLIDYDKVSGNINDSYGIDILISNSGFGGGLFYHYYLNQDWLLFADMFISYSRNGDEFERYNYVENYWRVPNKVSRLYRLPVNFGIQRFLFRESLVNIKPYVSAGVGPGFIFSIPYAPKRDPYAKPINFFSALDKTDTYVRPAVMVAFGVHIPTAGSALLGLNIKYYSIPFGDDGLESIMDSPIKDFGGFILSLSVGKLY